MKPDEQLIKSIQHCAEQDPDEYGCVGCEHSAYCFYDYVDDIEELTGGKVINAPMLARALLPMIMGEGK